ncbi:MAG TPA: DNA methylase [bacterium]|nr:DNA methylase [bacterium]
MAKSYAHQFGQIIGEVVEEAMKPILQAFAKKHDLFLDCKGDRPARTGKKVSWKDRSGNVHDLDFVLERGGSPEKIGTPAAFIETAWRSYTKHSRNKAQEIQGAIIPLAEKYRSYSPFIGVILAGVFTKNALDQLSSLGFTVLSIPSDKVIAAFSAVGIDASFKEKTPEAELKKKISAWNRLGYINQTSVTKALTDSMLDAINEFIKSLESTINRSIVSVYILPLHGVPFECTNIQGAIGFIEKYNVKEAPTSFVRFEVSVRYNNGDRITGEFDAKTAATKFLRSFVSTH